MISALLRLVNEKTGLKKFILFGFSNKMQDMISDTIVDEIEPLCKNLHSLRICRVQELPLEVHLSMIHLLTSIIENLSEPSTMKELHLDGLSVSGNERRKEEKTLINSVINAGFT